MTSATIKGILRVLARNFPEEVIALEQLADLAGVDRALRELRPGSEVVYQLNLVWNVLDNDGFPTEYRQTFRKKKKAVGEGGLTMAEIMRGARMKHATVKSELNSRARPLYSPRLPSSRCT